MEEFDQLARVVVDGLMEPLGLDPKRDRTLAIDVLAIKLRAAFRPRTELVEAVMAATERAEAAEKKLAQMDVTR